MSELTVATIEKIQDLTKPVTVDIGGEVYALDNLTRVAPYIPFPDSITVRSLTALCELIKTEIKAPAINARTPLFVEVESYRKVKVCSTFYADLRRDKVYTAECDTPEFEWRNFMPHENAIISLQSRFVPNDGQAYLLDLLDKITIEDGVSSVDTGVSQTVEARKGVSLKQNVKVNPFINLAPFRTFLEVTQPESKMLLRINERGEILLTEADGGMWKLDAKDRIKTYLQDQLLELVESGKVIVIS